MSVFHTLVVSILSVIASWNYTVEGTHATVEWTWQPYGNEWTINLTKLPEPEVQIKVESTSARTPYQTVQDIFGPSAEYAWFVVIKCETGGTYDNTLVGKEGEVTRWQIHPIHFGRWDRQRLLDDWDYATRAAYTLWKEARYKWFPTWSCG